MIKRIPLNDLTRPEVLARRQHYIGASEVAIPCGESHYGSEAELYAEKKGLRPPRIDGGVLRRGRWGEAAAFEALADERPEWPVVRANVQVVDEERRQECLPDGFAERNDRDGIGIVQAKTVARSVFRRWLDNPDDNIAHGSFMPPSGYVLQTVQEMKLNGCSWGVLAIVIIGEFDWHFRLFEVERNPVIEARIDYHVDRFFREYLDPGIMPPFEPQRDELLVKALFPKDAGTTIDLSGDNRALALVEDLIETQTALKRLDKQEKTIKTELQGKLKDNTFGLLADGRRLSWRLQHRRGFTVEASDYRVFRILSAKPED
jgi:predicted phage-related endonuclease